MIKVIFLALNTGKNIIFLCAFMPLQFQKTKKLYPLLIVFLFFAISYSQCVADTIKVNQTGYYTNASKIAIFTGLAAGSYQDAKTFYETFTNIKDTLLAEKQSKEK